MSGLDGKRVIITGGASGIGRATAAEFRQRGARVVVADILAPGDGADRDYVQTDISQARSVELMVATAVERLEGLDAVVNIAGIQRAGAIDQLDEHDWDDQFAVNVRSCFLTSKYAVPHLRRQLGSTIITTGSLAAQRGFGGMTAYCATKGAIVSFTRALAVELAPDGIRCNAVCPGWTSTPFNDPAIDFMGGTDAAEAEIARTVPLGRQAQPSEIAKVIAFLASEDSGYMTGQAVFADGGLST